jgi:hypothetical protein
MSPKEKAYKLVEKIYYDIDFNLVGMSSTKKMVAKQCALIAVDEILKSKKQNIIHFYRCGDEFCECAGYWYEVKQEIELL